MTTLGTTTEAKPLRMGAYYYSFDSTGVRQIDLVLSAVACAGKAFHHTEDWRDDCPTYSETVGANPVEWIQNAAKSAANRFDALTGANKKLCDALVLMYDKWENGARCYEDPEDYTGYLGNAFKLTDEEEARVLEALEAAGIKTALTFARAHDRALVEPT